MVGRRRADPYDRRAGADQSYAATFQASAAPPAIAAYAFNEGSGTTAADASGNGLTGTLTNGATWGAGRNAGAV